MANVSVTIPKGSIDIMISKYSCNKCAYCSKCDMDPIDDRLRTIVSLGIDCFELKEGK